jgi:hypothetical protein
MAASMCGFVKTREGGVINEQCSMFNAHCSLFTVHCSLFNEHTGAGAELLDADDQESALW